MSKKLSRLVMQDNLREGFQKDYRAARDELLAELKGNLIDVTIDLLFKLASTDKLKEMHECYCEGQSQIEMDQEAGRSLDRQR